MPTPTPRPLGAERSAGEPGRDRQDEATGREERQRRDEQGEEGRRDERRSGLSGVDRLTVPPWRSPRADGRRPRTDRADAPRHPRRRMRRAAPGLARRSRSASRSARTPRIWASARARRASAVRPSRSVARCRSSAASSSGTPSPVDAVVTRTSGRFGAGRSGRGIAARHGRHEHRPELRGGPQRARLVALVDDDEVGDLEQAGLDGLDLVAHLGRLEHDGRVGRGRDLDLALARPDRLDEHEVEARRRRARPRRPWSSRPGRRRARATPSTG